MSTSIISHSGSLSENRRFAGRRDRPVLSAMPQAMSEPRIRKTAVCSAPTTKVFRALTAEELVEQWMTAVVEIDLRPGGAISIESDGWPLLSGEIVELEPPTRLALRWKAADWANELTTSITLSAAGDDTEVEVVEEGYGDDDELLRQRSNLWSHWLIRLSVVSGMGG